MIDEGTTRSYEARLASLLAASEVLLYYMGTGYEPHGQSMHTTMAHRATREFRKACADLGIKERTEGG